MPDGSIEIAVITHAKCFFVLSMIKNGRLLFDKGIQEMQGQSLEEIFIKEGNRYE